MEIPGFYYDSQRKKYFKIESGVSGQNRITRQDLKAKTSLDTYNDYKRLDSATDLPKALHKQEIDCQTKYNLREEYIRSQLKTIKKNKTSDIELINFCGDPLKNSMVDSLIGSPESDLLFGVFTGENGSVIYQLSVKDVFSDDFDANQSKVLINAFPKRNRVIDMSYITDSERTLLSVLVHHFPDPNTLNTSFTLNVITPEVNIGDTLRYCYEFAEPIFSATHFDGLSILGAEKAIHYFKPFHSNDIKVIQTKDKTTALKMSSDGKFFIAGTNRGQLTCYDIREDNKLYRRSKMKLNDKSVVYLQCLNDSNGVIASCHNNYLCLTDLRMFRQPVIQYSSHSNSCSKIPICVDQTVDVLCSSGDDSLVRFWSISSGKLLNIYCPEVVEKPLENRKRLLNSNAFYSHSWNCLDNQLRPLLFTIFDKNLISFTNQINY